MIMDICLMLLMSAVFVFGVGIGFHVWIESMSGMIDMGNFLESVKKNNINLIKFLLITLVCGPLAILAFVFTIVFSDRNVDLFGKFISRKVDCISKVIEKFIKNK